MVKQIRFQNPKFLMVGLYLLVTILIWRMMMAEFRLDDSFITYRYARNFASGLGLVYNPGDQVLSTTAPLYALFLGLVSHIMPDFHLLGGLIGTLSIGLGGWLISRVLPSEFPEPLRLWGGLIYVLSSPLWFALGMETALWITLVLAAVLLSQSDHWGAAGFAIGLATLTRPDAALPGMLIGLVALVVSVNRLNTRTRWWQPIAGFGIASAIPLLIFAVWAYISYGSPFPVTLGAKGAQATQGITGMGVGIDTWEGLRLILRSLMTQSSLYIVLALLTVFGLARRIQNGALLVVIWGALHLIVYVILGVAPYRWYYAPLVPGAVLLATTGLYYLYERLRFYRYPVAIGIVSALAIFPVIAQGASFAAVITQIREGGPVDVMLPIVDWDVYRQTGEWLDVNTALDATVGVAEVGQVGFYARRWMTDYLGLLQPEVSAMLRRGDFYSWMIQYAPDYMVFQRFRGAALVLYNLVIQDDAWFNANYEPVTEFDDMRYSSGPVTIFRRATILPNLIEQPATLDFGNLKLVGLATDGHSLSEQGGSVRVRLDWQVEGDLPQELHIAVKGLNMGGTNPGFDGDYQTPNWSGTFSTWHGFVVPKVDIGTYVLLVAVGPVGGPYLEQAAGSLHVVASN